MVRKINDKISDQKWTQNSTYFLPTSAELQKVIRAFLLVVRKINDHNSDQWCHALHSGQQAQR